MSVNTGRFTPHPPASACGTHQAVPSPHAAFVRPCARNPCYAKQARRAREEDVVIVVGPQPVTQRGDLWLLGQYCGSHCSLPPFDVRR